MSTDRDENEQLRRKQRRMYPKRFILCPLLKAMPHSYNDNVVFINAIADHISSRTKGDEQFTEAVHLLPRATFFWELNECICCINQGVDCTSCRIWVVLLNKVVEPLKIILSFW